MTPEELARQDIDLQLGQCGWVIQSRNEMNILAAPGVAIPIVGGTAVNSVPQGAKQTPSAQGHLDRGPTTDG